MASDPTVSASDQAQNVFANGILPVDPRKMNLLFGSAEYVAVEVLISKIVRRFMKADRGWFDLILVHTLSLPFLGAPVAFMDPVGPYGEDWGDQFMSGAKGIPAVLIAEWIMSTFAKGFHVPWFTMKDLLITAGAKTISRPISSSFYQYLPKQAKDSLALVNQMIINQNAKSNLKSADANA